MIYCIFITILYIFFLMFHIQRTSKAQALQSMKTVLPTPKSERLQQNRESDWTPGSYISQEEVSFATPPQPGQALVKINEGLMETKWERADQEEKTLFVRKATEACKIVCSAIAPEAGEKLFQTVCKEEDSDIENELIINHSFKPTRKRLLKTRKLKF